LWYPNQFVMMVSNANDKKTALACYSGPHAPLKKILHDKVPDWKINARNKEQAFAIDLLMNPDIKIVSLIGRAGSGKTLMAIAAGLQQTIGIRSEYNHYTRLIVSRPVQPLGKDIGFLPGTMQEKMLPWLMPIQDNLKFLMGDRTSLEMYIEKGKIEIEALTYIRGRSIANAFVVIDEAQNLTKHEIKTIITRIGDGTKIILTGDIEQIDNIYVNETSNGLAHAVESFKQYPIAGHVTFKKGERSELATLASKVL
jgi:PhoH-like ATPase